jgi:hypothetical protein
MYRRDIRENVKILHNIIDKLEGTIISRESTINDLQAKLMAKDLTDYKINTREPSTEFVQTEPEDIPLETATDEQFLKAIKEAPVQPTESVSQ